ncbi:MAG: class I SAM-dependent RNA methyltransferase [Myxococcota bacterium]
MTPANGELLDAFAASPPGLERDLASEIAALGLEHESLRGGVSFLGGWQDVWTANLWLRSASRVLVRVGEFRAMHLAQLDKRARKLPWSRFLNAATPVAVEATCRRSKIYHSGAATERLARAIQEELGAKVVDGATVRVIARIDDDLCTVSVDTSGEPLHKRGYKLEVGKAPLRENLAAAFLRECGYRGDEPFVDPMCGSGTLAIEAAQIAAGLAPGALRRFAFEALPSFEPDRWSDMVQAGLALKTPMPVIYGSDRDAGAVRMSGENAARAGVGDAVRFARHAISDLQPLSGTPGLVLTNPPYGARIGDPDALRNLYATLGQVLKERFKGWRVGLVTSDRALAHATRLPFKRPGPPVPHGGLRVQLYRAGPL